jgi:hypothetical protein
MLVNLIKELQESSGYEVLVPVDPNKQDIPEAESVSQNQKIGQAGIPTILLGYYFLSRSKEGAEFIISGKNSTEWGKQLFKNREEAVIEKIMDYSSADRNIVAPALLALTKNARIIISNQVSEKTTVDDIMSLFTNEHHNILRHLPGTLQMGELLGDNTSDDQTHKMDGPISSMMHNISKGFSGSTNIK